MLKHLSVYNYVLIHDIHIDLDEKLSVFTGETGAGKSLLVGSLNALMGQRINASVIGQQDDFARIEGVFSFQPNEQAYQLLQEMGIDLEDDVIFTREINRDGKNVCKINFRTVNLSVLKEVLSSAVDIHSQHDTQYLLNSRIHLSLLDSYAHHEHELELMKKAFQQYANLKKQLEELLSGDLNADYIDTLQMDVDRISSFNPTDEDFDAIQEKAKAYNAYEKLVESLNLVLQILDDEPGVLSHFYQAIKVLHGLSEFDEIHQISTQLEENYYVSEDLRNQLENYRDGLEYDEEDVNRIQARIFEYHKLMRKYGNSIDDVLLYRDEALIKIDQFEHRNERLESLKLDVETSYEEASKLATKLSNARKTAARQLEASIINELNDLMLPNAQFEVDFTLSDLKSTGIDQVEFYVSMNRGEPTQPLAKVASGGELSRFMLGIKTILNRVYGISTTLFDEIDSGVSGKVALSIGQKMKQIAEEIQVITVSHLAPVAACAHEHFLISKELNDDRTISSITRLTQEQRIYELAMISTGNTNESSLLAAKELFEIGQDNHG